MENMDNVIELWDENGQRVPFEYLDTVTYAGEEYVVLMPAPGEADPGEVVILRIDDTDCGPDEQNYLAVEDEDTLNAVFRLFKARNRDRFTFED